MRALFPALALTVALAAAASAQPNFYGVTFDGDQLVNVDGATGGGSQAGALAGGLAPSGLAAYNGNLYTFDTATDTVDRISPLGGGTVATYNIGVSGLVGEGGLAFRSDGTGFLSAPLDANFNPIDALYSFSLDGGAATLIGSTSDALSGLAFAPNGTLYGIGKGDGELYTINTSTGATTTVGSLGLPDAVPGVPGYSDIGALTFTSDGTLYAAVNDALYTVSTSSGTATLIDPNQTGTGIGFSSVSGLAPAAAVNVPEPAPALLLALGLLPVLGAMRRRRP